MAPTVWRHGSAAPPWSRSSGWWSTAPAPWTAAGRAAAPRRPAAQAWPTAGGCGGPISPNVSAETCLRRWREERALVATSTGLDTNIWPKFRRNTTNAIKESSTSAVITQFALCWDPNLLVRLLVKHYLRLRLHTRSAWPGFASVLFT